VVVLSVGMENNDQYVKNVVAALSVNMDEYDQDVKIVVSGGSICQHGKVRSQCKECGVVLSVNI
jgi:hypothetical protein